MDRTNVMQVDETNKCKAWKQGIKKALAIAAMFVFLVAMQALHKFYKAFALV